MNLNDILNTPFTFTKRKNFTACDARPLWKSCLIILILGVTGRKNTASLKKIHTANWVSKKEEHLTAFTNWAGKADRKRPNVRLEPSIDRVINLLVSSGAVTKSSGNITLSASGAIVFNELMQHDVYVFEKRCLAESKKHLSEAAVKRLFEGV